MTVGSGPEDLVSSPAEKRAAAQAIAEDIEPGTHGAGQWADEETGAAVRAFGARDGDGWHTSSALRTAQRTWADQVRNLMDRLGAEKDALGAAHRVLTGADLAVGSTLRESAALRTPAPAAPVGMAPEFAAAPEPAVSRPVSALDRY